MHAVEISLLQNPIVLEMWLFLVNTCPASTTDLPACTYINFFQEQSVTNINPFLFAKICSSCCRTIVSTQFKLPPTRRGMIYI